MITINNLSKSYGTRVLFDNLSFSVGKGEKIGLVGRNGYGKTTLLKMITGEAEYDSGEIQIPKNYKIGYLKQHLDFKYKTIIEEVPWRGIQDILQGRSTLRNCSLDPLPVRTLHGRPDLQRYDW